MNFFHKTIMTILMMILSSPLFAAEKMRIAVLDLKAVGVFPQTAQTISNMLRTDLVNMRKFIVVERNQMDQILKEQGFQQTGCTDQSCAVEIGKLISANKILMGEVSVVGKTIYVTVRIVDVEKGVSDFAARETCDEATIDRAVSSVSKKLSARIGGRGFEEEGEITRTGYYLRGIVPGWGQIYSGHTVKGSIIAGGFVASAGFLGWAIYNSDAKHKAYKDVPDGSSQSAFDSKYNDYKNANLLVNVSIGILSAVYLYNWVDIVFFSRPQFTAYSPGLPLSENHFLAVNAGYTGYNEQNCVEFRMGLALTYRM